MSADETKIGIDIQPQRPARRPRKGSGEEDDGAEQVDDHTCIKEADETHGRP